MWIVATFAYWLKPCDVCYCAGSFWLFFFFLFLIRVVSLVARGFYRASVGSLEMMNSTAVRKLVCTWLRRALTYCIWTYEGRKISGELVK